MIASYCHEIYPINYDIYFHVFFLEQLIYIIYMLGIMEKRNKITGGLKESVLGEFYVIHTAWQRNVELLY